MTTISDASEDTSKSRTSPSSPFVSGGLGVLTSVKSACDGEWAMRREETDAFEYELALLVLLRLLGRMVLRDQCILEAFVWTYILPAERGLAFAACDVAHDVLARRHRPLDRWPLGDVDPALVSPHTFRADAHNAEEVRSTVLTIELLRRVRR